MKKIGAFARTHAISILSILVSLVAFIRTFL